MNKFKVGDPVITLVDYLTIPKGTTLKIAKYGPQNDTTQEHYICIKVENYSKYISKYTYYPHELKLSQPYINEIKLKKALGLE